MKIAIWLYLFLFVAFFDLHAQYPILTPFAISLGAAPSFIGLMMGIYSFTHLPGNLIAGFSVDRYGSRIFIIGSLFGAGLILLFQAHISNPWQLLFLRSISGFVLAFLSPACLSLLARLARDHIQQGKLMAGNGLVHTLASVVSPAAGAFLVAQIGFSKSFTVLGWVLIAIAGVAIFAIHDRPQPVMETDINASTADIENLEDPLPQMPWRFFVLPLAIACSQGILFFELPLMKEALESIMKAGVFFSVISLGALLTLSLLFLSRYSAHVRTWIGSLALAISFFAIAIPTPFPLIALLFIVGMSKGIIFPAMSSYLIELSGGTRYGRMFSTMSIASSIGYFIGPLLAGQLRELVSPYFIAFFILMTALCILPSNHKTRPQLLPTLPNKS
ncbi:MFS transporter [Paenibacillus selenitireducens]|uniref:MFS transporter n=1 Tax=Paenibacillus selenitireducens TaxID=1324314 RepID=A0A1T2XJG5_9BACL|nr:MFS transporter [Paenibacillus selenitireducens]OPA80004.1 MFS transporter [Paenibacillus selenitireducens]